jgi:hypothetical protein
MALHSVGRPAVSLRGKQNFKLLVTKSTQLMNLCGGSVPFLRRESLQALCEASYQGDAMLRTDESNAGEARRLI